MPVSMPCARGQGKRAEEWQGPCFWAWENPGGSQSHFLSSLTRITGTSQLKTHEVTEFQVVNVEFCCCVFHHEGSGGLRTLGYSGTGRFFFLTEAPFQHRQYFFSLKLLWGEQAGRYDITELETSSLRGISWHSSLIPGGSCVRHRHSVEGGNQLFGKWLWSTLMRCPEEVGGGVLGLGSDLVSGGCWSCWKHLQH